MQILSPASYRTMPWKNGLGITHEIAAQRSDEDLASGRFTWRLSVAEVTASAPFSSFPGCDRIIVLLSGDGMLLDSGVYGQHRLDQPLVPYPFSGDWSTDCRLLGGPCRDFNVMVDRRRVQATVQVVKLSSQPQALAVADSPLLLFVADGDLHVDTDAGRSAYVPVQHTLFIHTDESIPATTKLTLTAAGDSAAALLIALHPRDADPSTQARAAADRG
ncbi:MAG: HutD family protein [Myxococcales bacterium]|nr:HutD family protein [Myxococcales bacterium]